MTPKTRVKEICNKEFVCRIIQVFVFKTTQPKQFLNIRSKRIDLVTAD